MSVALYLFLTLRKSRRFFWDGSFLDLEHVLLLIQVLTAENVFSRIGSAYPTTGKLFEPVEIPVESVSYISEVGLVEDGKLSMHDPSSVQKILTKINTTLRAEVEGQYSSWFLGIFRVEAAIGGVLQKWMFLKISQILQENTCVGVSF